MASGNRPFFQNSASQTESPVTLVISHYLYIINRIIINSHINQKYLGLFSAKMFQVLIFLITYLDAQAAFFFAKLNHCGRYVI